MSRLDAAGWARSRLQSVSVVPMIQWPPHGSTNSTDVGVRRIRPASPVIADRGTTRWTPLDARTRSPGRRAPTIAEMSLLHTPVAATTVRAPTRSSSAVSWSRTVAPVTSRASRMSPTTSALGTIAAPRLAAVRAIVATYRASSTCPS